MTLATPGASMHYTLTGMAPTESDPLVSSGSAPALGSAPVTTLWVKAFKPGWSVGSTSAQYRLAALPPTLSPAPGAFATPQEVTFAATTPGSTVRFTTDGNWPTAADPMAEPGFRLWVDRNTVVRAMAFRDDLLPSQPAGGSYEFVPASPRFFPAPGTYSDAQMVSLSATTPGATIRYTTDGSSPTATSPVYASPILVADSMLVRARAFVAGWSPGDVATGEYTITAASVAPPTFDPPPGRFAATRHVAISCATPGASIRYTLDGAEPTLADPSVTSGGHVTIDSSSLLKARAWSADLGAASATRSGAYLITGAVSAGTGFLLALKADGSVLAWGVNDAGQLGDGTGLPSTAPVTVSGLGGVVAISAGAQHALALREDGSVWAWGRNVEGQLGDNTFVSRLAPVQVAGLADVVAVSAGSAHSLALKADGSVFAWGKNGVGELGVGDPGNRDTPARVYGYQFQDIAAISAGDGHSQALGRDGQLWGWGSNYYGEVGFLPTASYDNVVTAPRAIPSVSSLLGVSANDGHGFSFGIVAGGATGGSLVAWGAGLDPYAYAVGPDEATAVDVGVPPLALLNDRTVRDLWSGSRILGLRDDVAVSSGNPQALAVTASGQVFAWQLDAPPVAVEGLQLTLSGASIDADSDGLSLLDELRLGTNPLNPDTNGDGLSDGLAVALGLSPTNPDMDGDGVANPVEISRGTDPFRADSDGDGASDGSDCFPLDPTLQCPQGAPGDTSPPAITILRPSNAVLVSSLP